MSQILTLKREARFSGNPDDESIIISTNHRTLHFSKDMAKELRDALTVFLAGTEPRWENETARLVREAEEQRNVRAHREAAEHNRRKTASTLPSFTTLEDLA